MGWVQCSLQISEDGDWTVRVYHDNKEVINNVNVDKSNFSGMALGVGREGRPWMGGEKWSQTVQTTFKEVWSGGTGT